MALTLSEGRKPGSGRRPDPVKRFMNMNQPVPADAGTFNLPNYSGIQDAAKKTAPPVGTGSGGTTDHAALSNLDYASAGHTGFQETVPFADLSGAYFTHAGDTTIHFTSGALYTKIDSNTANITNVSGSLVSTSGALNTLIASNKTNITNVSGSLVTTSGALSTLITSNTTNINTVSGGLFALSGAHSTTSANLASLSGSYFTHAGDSSDPHGATLTQTNINSSGTTSGGHIVRTGDWTTSGAAYVPNVVYNTTSGGLTASNYPISTLLVVYS